MQDSNFQDNGAGNNGASQGGYKSFNDKPPMIEGNWKCSECGAEITKLPFKPQEGRSVSCSDCYKKRSQRNFHR